MGGVFSIRSWDIDMDELTNVKTPVAPTSSTSIGGRRNHKRKTRKRRQVKS
jgi:hypothetical protein